MKKLKDLFKDENGATAAEYGLFIALIALIVITVVTGINKSSAKSSSVTISLIQSDKN